MWNCGWDIFCYKLPQSYVLIFTLFVRLIVDFAVLCRLYHSTKHLLKLKRTNDLQLKTLNVIFLIHCDVVEIIRYGLPLGPWKEACNVPLAIYTLCETMYCCIRGLFCARPLTEPKVTWLGQCNLNRSAPTFNEEINVKIASASIGNFVRESVFTHWGVS